MKQTTYSAFTQSQLEVLRDSLNLALITALKETGRGWSEESEKNTSFRVGYRLWAEVVGEIMKRNQ